MTIKRIFVSAISAVVVSLFAVGISIVATFLYYYFNGQQAGELITTSRMLWFLIISALSFLFIFFGLDKEK